MAIVAARRSRPNPAFDRCADIPARFGLSIDSSAPLSGVHQLLAAFEDRYNQAATPFDWTFGRDDLDKVCARIDAHDCTVAA